MTAEDRLAELVEEFAGDPAVELPTAGGSRRFGSDALKVNGSIFAMVVGGNVVVKLPRPRVDALIADGTGTPFGTGKGRPMREWVALPGADRATCAALAGEALAFVRSRPPKRR